MSYFETTNLDKDRAFKKLRQEKRFIIQKFRRVLLVDATKLQNPREDVKGLKFDTLLEKVYIDTTDKKIRLLRACNELITDFMSKHGVTPQLIASALGVNVRAVERILQGFEKAPDLRLVASIASLLCMSCGELIDVCYLRRKGNPFSDFLTSHKITERARVWIDKFMIGKRLAWWDELRGYIYEKNRNKNKE